jgi:hypothetical protein
MGSAQSPISLNRYLYAHANPEAMIDPDGHRATELDSRASLSQRVQYARTSVRAAAEKKNKAAAEYNFASAKLGVAVARLGQVCDFCRNRTESDEWRQSLLNSVAAARAARDAARARLDAAAAAHQAAVEGLRSAEAALRAAKNVKPKPPGGGVTAENIARYAVGFVGGAAKSVATVAVGTAYTIGACAVNCTSTVRAVASAGAGAIADPGAAVRNTANAAASTIGRMRDDLLSGDGFRTGGTVGEITIIAAPVAVPVAAAVRAARVASLADDAIVVRGGLNTADRISSGTGVWTDSSGLVHDVSVNSANGVSLPDLAAGIKNNQIGVTTVGDIRAAGGSVKPDPIPGNPYHCLVSGISAAALSGLLQPPIANPCK